MITLMPIAVLLAGILYMLSNIADILERIANKMGNK